MTNFFHLPFHSNNACPSAAVYKETADAIWLGSWKNVNNNDFIAAKLPARYPTASAYKSQWDKEARGRRSRFAPCPTNYMVSIDWDNSWNSRVTTTEFDYSAPSKKWDAEAAAKAVEQQRKVFGDLRPGAEGKIRGCDVGLPVFTSNKKQIKSRELDRALSLAFAPRAKRNSEWLTLDTNHDSSWTPTTEGVMDQMEEEEQEEILAEATQYRLDLLLRTITAKQKQALILKSEGKTLQEIAEIQGNTFQAVANLIKRAQATARTIWAN